MITNERERLEMNLSSAKKEALHEMDVIISDFKAALGYMTAERNRVADAPLQDPKEDETELIGSFLTLLMRAGSNARVDKLQKRSAMIFAARRQLMKLPAPEQT